MIQVLSYMTVIMAALFLLPASPVLAGGRFAHSEPAAFDEAKALVEEGSFAAALPKLEGLVQADPGHADAWSLLGFSYRALGELDESLAAYQRVLAIDPDHRGALEQLGEILIHQGKTEAGRSHLDRLHHLDADEAEEIGRAA